MPRNRNILALVVFIVWFYLLLAVVLNPSYVSPIAPNNPVMPFLSAEAVSYLWPLVLVTSPIALLAGKRLARPSEGQRREVSPEEFVRIQARAHRMSARDRESTSRQEAEVPSPEGSTSTKVSEPASAPTTKDAGTTETAVVRQSEFTPPPSKTRAAKMAEQPSISDRNKITQKVLEQKETETSLENKRIDELEAEKGAVMSLLSRLEEMKSAENMKPELYEKLKKRYANEIERINARIEEFATKESTKEKGT